MSEEEVDNTDCTKIDVYTVALDEINQQGGGSKRENDEITRAFMG